VVPVGDAPAPRHYPAAMARSTARTPSGRPARITPRWLAHHLPEDYDRCVLVGRSHVCRRCLVLYPVAFAVMAVTRSWHPPPALDVALVAGLPLPGVVEFLAEHLGAWRHSPVRQVAVTLPLAVGLGRGFARYLDSPGDALFWSTVVGYGAVCGIGAWVRQRRPRG
jgi:hypothetical protein